MNVWALTRLLVGSGTLFVGRLRRLFHPNTPPNHQPNKPIHHKHTNPATQITEPAETGELAGYMVAVCVVVRVFDARVAGVWGLVWVAR